MGRCRKGVVAIALSIGGFAQSACISSSPERPTDTHAVELALRDTHGQTLALSALRGRPTIIWVFATYDASSQLALAPLEVFAGRHRDVNVVGIAVQPQADQLLPLFADSLDVHFPLAYDPAGVVLSGSSDLGTTVTVPSYVLLSAAGEMVASHSGALDVSALEALLEAAID